MKPLNQFFVLLLLIHLCACEKVATTVVKEITTAAREDQTSKRAHSKKNKKPLREGRHSVENKGSQTTATATYKDGKKQGRALQKFSNGKVWKEVNYKDNRLHGLAKVFNRQGDLVRTVMYNQGQKHGPYTRYYKSGTKKLEIEFFKDYPLPGIVSHNALGERNPRPQIEAQFLNSKLSDGSQIRRVNISLKGRGKLVKAYAFAHQEDYEAHIPELAPYELEEAHKGNFTLELTGAAAEQSKLERHVFGIYELSRGLKACVYKKVEIQFGP